MGLNYIEKNIEKILSKECSPENFCKNSYIKGLVCINELVILYKKVESKPVIGRVAISALEKTINEGVLRQFLNNIEDKIEEKIVNRHKITIPYASTVINDLSIKYSSSEINYDSFMAGVQEVVKILKTAYYHPRTSNWKGIINFAARGNVERIVSMIIAAKKGDN
ncbi:hypothetical protein COZ55_00705 [archaeon CG_4_8_14_3_um_filter_38_5]|nr:MAG: hypothetical protein COS83_04480 [archaeon CG07_land_8_20_14_0_80_38_8]PIU89242.1 MAG: hypothetical protein COS64_01500 [archaeon CG06_land_8_20_14_3_00_37_11]PIX44033.1 MAG: hypothetical protein COZ55_00705 [archaeon CG_4_8_14_3_um_filter_38_5]